MTMARDAFANEARGALRIRRTEMGLVVAAVLAVTFAAFSAPKPRGLAPAVARLDPALATSRRLTSGARPPRTTLRTRRDAPAASPLLEPIADVPGSTDPAP